MKRFLLFSLAILLLFPSATQAKSGSYVGAKLGLTQIYADDIDWGLEKEDGDFFSVGFGAIIGYDFSYNNPPNTFKD